MRFQTKVFIIWCFLFMCPEVANCVGLARDSMEINLTKGSAIVDLIVERDHVGGQSADIYEFTLLILPDGYRSQERDATRVQMSSLTSVGGPVRNCYVGLAYPTGSLEILSARQSVFDQSGGQWKEIPEISSLEKQLLDITVDIVKQLVFEQYPILYGLEAVFEWSNELAEAAYRSESERFLQHTNFSVQPVRFQSFGAAPSARKITFRVRMKNSLNDNSPLSFLIDAAVNYVQPMTFPMVDAPMEGIGHLDQPVLFTTVPQGSEVSKSPSDRTRIEYRANYPSHDGFEDEMIDSDLWVTGGAKRGWSEGKPTGIGDWTYSVREIESADGYLRLRVKGPESGLTYGAEAWARSVYDFNDGNDHLINFSWEADVRTRGHYDHYYIQVTDGYIPRNGSVHWPENQSHEGTVNLLCKGKAGGAQGGLELKYGLSKTTWSLMIRSNGMASLYDRSDASGDLVHSVKLNLSKSWHIRFMVIDATSAGFPAGDDRLNLHDFAASFTSR